MTEDLKNILVTGAKELGVTLDSEAVSRFDSYLMELKRWNEKVNLTAITDDREIIINHFLDSISLVKYLNEKREGQGAVSILDIGSGAGLPGLALKIAVPNLKVLLMEPVEKKTHFLKHMIRTLKLTDIEAVALRAEDKIAVKTYGHSFDIVTSRALTELKTFITLATPYLNEKGLIIAMKGPKDKKLALEAENLNCTIIETQSPYQSRKTSIVIVPRGT